jgi:diacylglycerol O-acyltransferase
MPAREPMSHVDTAWLRMDQPNNLMQIVGVMLFAGTLDPERLRSSIEKRLLAYDRFKQVVQQNDGGYSWVDDPEFDLDQHLHHAVLPGAAGKPELQRFVADLASTPLNPSRPLWAFHVVDTALGGQALVMRIHHCIADGIALLGVILSMADESAPPPRHSTAKNREEAADDFFWQTIWQPMNDAHAGFGQGLGEALAQISRIIDQSQPGD